MNAVEVELARVGPGCSLSTLEEARDFISDFRRRKREGSLPLAFATDPRIDRIDLELRGDRLFGVFSDVAPGAPVPGRGETIVLAHGSSVPATDDSRETFSPAAYYLRAALAARHSAAVSLASGEGKRRDARGLVPAPKPTGEELGPQQLTPTASGGMQRKNADGVIEPGHFEKDEKIKRWWKEHPEFKNYTAAYEAMVRRGLIS